MSPRADKRISTEGLGSKVSGLPLRDKFESTAGLPIYLVGGPVRDLLMGREITDIDLAVDGPLDSLLETIEGEVVRHEQFETASIRFPDGLMVDVARTRSESYPRPGALPVVEPASIEVDLGRRDFTINAMAIDLSRPDELMDPNGGRADLEQGILRALHQGSFRDDPTRALRGARYASRMNLRLAPETRDQLSDLDLTTVSAERIFSELALGAAEECESGALSEAIDWGLLPRPEGDPDLLAKICEVIASASWESYLASIGSSGTDILAALVDPASTARSSCRSKSTEAAEARPASGSEVASIASRLTPSEIIIARAMGAEWLDAWCDELRSVELEIGGDDLIAEGIEPGPLIGIGLTAALNAKLDGAVDGRPEEMRIALEACRSAEGQSL